MPALLDRLTDRRAARLPLMAAGTVAAGCAAGVGLAALTVLVLIGWTAAPHSGIGGLPGVFRAAALLWLVAHHVGLQLHGGGRFGMLPLGLVVLPGALLYRAGRWVVRSGPVARLRHVTAAAAALAAPYAALALILALVGRTPPASPVAWQAVLAAFLLAFVAGGLGGARELAPWGRLLGLLPDRPRSVAAGMLGALAVLGCAGAALAAGSLVAHFGAFGSVTRALAPGIVGGVLLLLLQVGYVPNAVIWGIAFLLGPGFAFGSGTVVAPSGSVVGALPMFPLLSAMPAGSAPGHPPAGMPGWLSVAVLATPYLAGVFAGVLVVRTAPNPSLGTAPLWGFCSGAAAGIVIGVLASFAGGPAGSGRLAVLGPSGWQAGLVATFGIGVAAALSAGIANWLASGRGPLEDEPAAGPARRAAAGPGDSEESGEGHRIYLDPWADEPVP